MNLLAKTTNGGDMQVACLSNAQTSNYVLVPSIVNAAYMWPVTA